MTGHAAKLKFVADPGRVRALAARIAAGDLSPVDLVTQYLARIEAIDGAVCAWRVVDSERALARARVLEAEARRGQLRGMLHGIPIAVKDIIDVEGLPTRCNSRSRENAPPATADAEIVLALKRQGAIVLGKAHTTEFAYFDPSPARNPHNTAHTPGGSSSGSAAAVAAGMAPIALGTQTVASVNRPAAYCGIAAFKPSSRSTSTAGIAPLAPSYDTVGFYGWSVDDAVIAYEAVAAPFMPTAPATPEGGIRIGLIDDPHLELATPEVLSNWEATGEAFAGAGHRVTRRKSPVPFARIVTLQRATMAYEAARIYRGLLDLPAGQIGPKFLEMVREGLDQSEDEYLAQRAELDGYRQGLFSTLDDDVFLWPAAPGPAPEGLASTGDPRFISPWTMAGGPIVTIPTGTTISGLPLACIATGRPGADAVMCGWARRLAEVVRSAP